MDEEQVRQHAMEKEVFIAHERYGYIGFIIIGLVLFAIGVGMMFGSSPIDFSLRNIFMSTIGLVFLVGSALASKKRSPSDEELRLLAKKEEEQFLYDYDVDGFDADELAVARKRPTADSTKNAKYDLP